MYKVIGKTNTRTLRVLWAMNEIGLEYKHLKVGVEFVWKSNGNKSAGLIAQDVQKVLPQAVKQKVSLDETRINLVVDYNAVIGLLVESVKELQKEIETLKSK